MIPTPETAPLCAASLFPSLGCVAFSSRHSTTSGQSRDVTIEWVQVQQQRGGGRFAPPSLGLSDEPHGARDARAVRAQRRAAQARGPDIHLFIRVHVLPHMRRHDGPHLCELWGASWYRVPGDARASPDADVPARGLMAG